MVIKDGICYPDESPQPVFEVVGCRALGGKRLRVRFNSGDIRDVDLSPLMSLPAFKPLSQDEVFRDFSLNDGIVTWLDGEIDIAPEWLFDHGETAGHPSDDVSQFCVAEDPVIYSANGAARQRWDFTRQRLFPGFDGKFCKIQPSVACDGSGTALLGFQKLLLTGSDVFYGQFLSKSTDGGRTWGEPVEQTALADTWEDGFRVARCATVRHAAKTGRWFALGMEELFKDDKLPFQECVDGRPYGRPIQVSVDAGTGRFTGYKALSFPLDYELAFPFGQVVECDNDILVPFYYCPPGAGHRSRCVTVRYAFRGDSLEVVEAGTPVARDDLDRGIGEPSLARLGGKVYMTLRSDEMGLWCESEDGGLTFSAPRPWTWTDGTPIGNRNTQQHWIRCGESLFLAYTRETPTNGHVFRNRAPIFMAEFDAERGGLIRETEFPLVPELGARLGNYCVADVGDGGWLITAEWMQPQGCERYGSDNSLWLVKVWPETSDTRSHE